MKIRQMLQKISGQRALYSGIGLLVVAVAVVVLTQLAGLLPNLRLDLTDDHLYTVTDGTKNMLKGIENPVQVELFFSAQMAEAVPQIGNHARRVQELLREYQRLADGKMLLNVIDPEAFSADEDRASELGLMSVPLVAGGPEIWFGLAVTGANGKTEIIDFFRPDREETLEYDLSQIIWKASRSAAPKIALFAGLEVQGGFDFMTRQPTPPWAAFSQLEQLYSIEALAPDFDHINDDVRLLMLVHPGTLPEKSLRAIDRYALAGGAVLVFVDPLAERAVGNMFGAAAETSSDLAPLFKAWGVEYDPKVVLGDAQLAVPVASNEMGRPAPHLGIQQFSQGEFPQDDPVTARLERLHAASAGVIRPRPGATSVFTALIESSDQAMLMPAEKIAQLAEHTTLYNGFQPSGERYAVAARISGKIGSAFAPAAGTAAAAPISTPVSAADASAAESGAKSANILIVADTDMLSDRLWVQIQNYMGREVAAAFADNGTFLVNAVDSLMGSADLMGIRGRGRYERPFTVVDDLERAAQMDLQAKQQELETQLLDTDTKLQALEAKKQQDATAFELDAAQVQELERFLAEKVRIRRELREVQHQLGSDIESLGAWLKMWNILLAPLILVLLVFGVARWRFRQFSR